MQHGELRSAEFKHRRGSGTDVLQYELNCHIFCQLIAPPQYNMEQIWRPAEPHCGRNTPRASPARRLAPAAAQHRRELRCTPPV